MKRYKIKQFAIVESTSASDFEMQLNEKMEELAECDPEVAFSTRSDTFARITYSKVVTTEDPKMTEAGVRFTCGECPLFCPERKKDGSPDERKKFGSCPYSEMERTWKASSACEMLYTMIKNGRVHLAIDEEEDQK